PYVLSWQPSARARAAGAPVEVNVAAIEPGAMVTVLWRGKPVWVAHRTEEMLASLAQVAGHLRDPDSTSPQQPLYCQNKTRSIKPQFLVLVGLCTHLGCIPEYRPEAAHGILAAPGFFCPCHGSKYDIAGRVYTGVPAPLNLQVPPYRYASDDLIVIGENPVKKAEAA
ncbi:MAG: ubiquinol-cytochrome c reductase iron-sulfur subunit, partial [Salinisphaera sp.]|nr:ubiquinol-cytochrome c reductase iron-sulfur subunit [Salinisphaera sp.]